MRARASDHAHHASPSSAAYPTCFPLTQFTCNNGRCININWRCDNGKDRAPELGKGQDQTQGCQPGCGSVRLASDCRGRPPACCYPPEPWLRREEVLAAAVSVSRSTRTRISLAATGGTGVAGAAWQGSLQQALALFVGCPKLCAPLLQACAGGRAEPGPTAPGRHKRSPRKLRSALASGARARRKGLPQGRPPSPQV